MPKPTVAKPKIVAGQVCSSTAVATPNAMSAPLIRSMSTGPKRAMSTSPRNRPPAMDNAKAANAIGAVATETPVTLRA